MKKVLAFILSLVLVFTLVAFVACDGSAGGNNFKEVDLTKTETREEFVNALAEKVDVQKLFGDYTQQGWTFGLGEKATSKLDFDLNMTPDDVTDAKYTAKGKIELSETINAKLTSNGATAAPDFAASMSLSAKGNADLSEDVYAFINGKLGESVGAIIKQLTNNFNYKVSGFVDKEGALVELSDSLYNKLPEQIQEMLGSKKIKLPFGTASTTMFAAADQASGGTQLNTDAVKESINEIIDTYLLPFKITVSVATKNGYALKLTANKESILTIINGAMSALAEEDNSLQEMISKSIAEAKFELTVRVDKDGGFSSIGTETSLKLNLDIAIPDFATIKGTLSLSGSVELSKFTGKISKPADAADYKEADIDF